MVKLLLVMVMDWLQKTCYKVFAVHKGEVKDWSSYTLNITLSLVDF